MKIGPDQTEYPEALRQLDNPPVLDVSAPLPSRARTVAIVGSREPLADSERFARDLAKRLAREGVVIVSGGAVGIDAAAHRGALEASGATWVVCGTGRKHVFPPVHQWLFDEVSASPHGRMIWPFAESVSAAGETFRARNRVLVALADVVVVVQARLQSGSRHAAGWARALGKPLHIVPGLPWAPYEGAFSGSTAELVRGHGRPLCSAEAFVAEVLGSTPREMRQRGTGRRPSKKKPTALETLPLPLSNEAWTEDEKLVFSVLSLAPTHLDEVSQRTCLPTGSAVTALLTLSMKDVVVEGPDGFFRRLLAR